MIFSYLLTKPLVDILLYVGIRRIQSILLKVALVLGAQVYPGVEFAGLEEPDDDHESSGWRIAVNPTNHPINLLNIDVLIGAEGKRVTIPGKNIQNLVKNA